MRGEGSPDERRGGSANGTGLPPPKGQAGLSPGSREDVGGRRAGRASVCVLPAKVLDRAARLWALLSKSFLNCQAAISVRSCPQLRRLFSPIRSLVDSLFNSVFIAVLSTVIVIPLAFTYAYALTRKLPCRAKPFFYALALLPLFAPSLDVGPLSLVLHLRNQGFLRALLFAKHDLRADRHR